jgi:hypothetical protein
MVDGVWPVTFGVRQWGVEPKTKWAV